jgi:CDP-glycerol glycerophosphotransferase (TagB/SpsB family)
MYGLLARSGALVTDYSSVWIDYLTLDRPIGFIIDDLAEYKGGRGLMVSNLEGLLPGPVLASADDCAKFFSASPADMEALRMARAHSAKVIGLAASTSATAALFALLSERRILMPSHSQRVP